jgi:hypothetical protein
VDYSDCMITLLFGRTAGLAETESS